MFGPDPIGVELISSTLASGWGLDVESIEYAPIGYGSYHWYVSAGGARWLVTADSDDDRPVASAYELTHRLGERFGFVRSPLATPDGGVVVERDGWLISVWPWVDGHSGSFGDEQSADQVDAVARCLRALHDCAGVPIDQDLIDAFEIPGRAKLEEIVNPSRVGTEIGPYTAEMGERVSANRSRLLGMLARFDELMAAVRGEAELVITHGEPHAANVVHAESGVVLIDWDTVRWAPRERDLWWLPGDRWRDAYGQDRAVSQDAIEMYRLRWTLFDVADFVPALMAAPEPTPDLEVALEWVRKLLPL